jgi:nitrogenase-stabilizing/protective protein
MLARIRDLESAEDFFELLAVDYDPRVLARARFPLLQRFAQELDDASRRDVPATEDEWLAMCQRTLRRAYDAFASPPPAEPQLTAAARLVRLRAPGRDRH